MAGAELAISAEQVNHRSVVDVAVRSTSRRRPWWKRVHPHYVMWRSWW